MQDSIHGWKNGARRIALFGMSGLGKTHLSNMLRASGGWFHYSVDYRIGTRYMGEHIADLFKKEAMQVPLLRELLLSDSIYIASNITFDNLDPLSKYLGKPGDPSQGGLPIAEYRRRQAQHLKAETAAMLDTAHFIDRAEALYGYRNFICDTSGSICEVVDPWDAQDPVLTEISKHMLLVWIEGDESHTEALIRRFDKAPKPMYYNAAFLKEAWQSYTQETGLAPDAVNPDAFIRWAYARALSHRQPRYAQMAKWGVRIKAADAAQATTPEAFTALIDQAIAARDLEKPTVKA